MSYVVEERTAVSPDLADREFAPADRDHPSLRWKAIIAGWFVATALAGLLYVCGLALGLSAFNAHESGANLKGIGIGSLIWMVLTWVVALFLGGMFSSWFDGRSDETTGTMHGITVWGVALTMTSLWLGMGLGTALQGDKPANSPLAQTAAVAAGGATAVLHARVARLVAPRGEVSDNVSAQADAIVAALLTRSDRTANDLLETDSTMAAGDASAALQRLTPSIEAARAQAKDAADKAATRTAWFMWTAFLSALLALIAAALGGWVGASHIHRVYHLRRYEGRPFRAR